MMTIPQYRCMSYHFLRNWSILRMSEGLHPHATPVISGTLMAHVRALGTPAWSILGRFKKNTPPI